MITKTIGIVLGNSDYKENDILVSVLSKNYGLITLVAKGAKKMTSKVHHSIMPYTEAEFIFEYHDNKTIFTLQKCNFIKNYYKKEDILTISAMNVIADIAKRVLLYEKECDLFNDVQKSLTLINEKDTYKVLALFISKISRIIGIEPYVDGCVVCNEPRVVTFSNLNGGFLCHKHAFEFECMEVNKLKKIRLLNKMDWEHFNYLDEVDYNIDDFILMADFFIEHSGMDIKSYRFYKTLLS